MNTTTEKFDEEVFVKNFKIHKSQQLIQVDASRKSSIDHHILDLVNRINESENYFTTSSCSGRFLAFSQDETYVKKNCEWISVTHDPLNAIEIEEFIKSIDDKKDTNREISLKYEPFILHICCRSLKSAKSMLEQAIASGCRNSGISIGSSKIILAVRSTQNLECPITSDGKLLVDHDFIRHICNIVNQKFKDNFERINKFWEKIETNCLSDDLKQIKSKKAEKENRKPQMDQIKEKIKKNPDDLCINDEDIEQDFGSLFT